MWVLEAVLVGQGSSKGQQCPPAWNAYIYVRISYVRMTAQTQEVEFTKASSKGQIVIPARIRKKFAIKEGSVLAVAARDDVIVLKKVEPGLSAEDLKSLRLIEEAWKDIKEGRYGVRSKEAFFKELKDW